MSDKLDMSKFKVEVLDLKNIVPYENNPRVNEGAVRYVKKSILEFNFQRPLIVDEDMILLAGHTRLKAINELRAEKVWETKEGFEWLRDGKIPTVVAKGLTEAEKRAFRIADNRASELTLFDFDKANLEIKDLAGSGIDMTDFGFEPAKADVLDADQATVEDLSGSTGGEDADVVVCPRCGKVVD